MATTFFGSSARNFLHEEKIKTQTRIIEIYIEDLFILISIFDIN